MKKRIILLSTLTLIAVIVIVIGAIIIPPGYSFGDKVVIMTSDYWITEKDGEFYLCPTNYKGTGPTWPEDDNINIAAPDLIYFDSLAELKSDFLQGNFTDEEMTDISMLNWNPYKGLQPKILLFDVKNLAEPMLPESMTVEEIYCSIGSYTLEYTNESRFSIIRQAEYNNWEERMLKYTLGSTPEDYIATADRDAKVYKSKYSSTPIGHYYTITTEDRTIQILEYYSATSTSSVPYKIELAGTHNGYCFKATIDLLSERPSIEWLSQFGVKKFEG